MNPQEFAGKDGFVWFTGIVEGRADPAMVGRVRVRIIGWHDENKNLAPTDSLPWAQVLMPVTATRGFSIPKEGEWVMGFFQDGMNGQMPVIMGVYPGIIPKQQTTYLNQKGYGVDVNTLTTKTTAQANTPVPPVGVVGDVKGEPTLPRQARQEMAGTIIDKQNNDLEHVCDFISVMQKDLKLKGYLKAAGQAIRDAIRKILAFLGLSDATGEASIIINTLKAYTRALNWITNNILKPIQDFEKYVIAYLVKLREMVQWILGLPEKFLAMLQDCLSRLYSLIRSVFTDLISGAVEPSTGDTETFEQITAEFKNASAATQDLLSNTLTVGTTAIGIVVGGTVGLLQPTNAAELAEADKVIAAYEQSDANKVTSPNEGKTSA